MYWSLKHNDSGIRVLYASPDTKSNNNIVTQSKAAPCLSVFYSMVDNKVLVNGFGWLLAAPDHWTFSHIPFM